MKKTQPSPSVASMVAEFEKRLEQSMATPTAHVKNTQKPPLPKRPTKATDTRVASQEASQASEKMPNIATRQESQTTQVKVAPPKPPRTKNRQQAAATRQENQTAQVKAAPPKPPQARNRQQAAATRQENQTAQVKVAPPKPPRTKNRQQDTATRQESQTAQVKVPPQRPPRARDRELTNNGVTQKNESPYGTPAPPKSLQTKDRTPTPTATEESEIIYAEIDIKTRSSTRHKERRSVTTQQEQTIYTTVASASISASLSKEEMIVKIRNNPLVQACKDEIRTLSQTVYGNPDIFQKKLEEIEKNPSLGDSLSWQVAAKPKLVAKLAGKKVLGIKNQTRKQAEENISPLCLALENYAETVKQAKEGILHGHLAKQIRHKHSLDLKQMAKDLQKPRTAAEKETTTLSQKEMLRRVKSNTTVQYCQAEIVYWCTIVYGDPRILLYRLEEIQKAPAIGENLAWQITTHPHIFGKFAGRKFSGIKNQARKDAENALPRLAEAIEGYAEAIKHATEDIVQTSHTQQRRHEQTVQEKSMQSQTKSPPLPERSPIERHQEVAQTSMQTDWERLGAKPRTATTCPKPALQQTQESVLPASHAAQKRHAPSPQQEKSVQSQTKSPALSGHPSTHTHQEAARVSMQTDWERLGARPRTATTRPKPALQQTQESVLPASHAAQKHHAPSPQQEKGMQSQTKSSPLPERSPIERHQEAAQTSMQVEKKPQAVQPGTATIPKTERTPPLSHKEISDRVQSDHSVQHARIEIYNWCNIVYNNPFVLQYNTEDVQKIPVLGEELAWQVANQPTMFAPLAGKQVLGVKNSARKHAEKAIPSLCAAIDNYTKAVKQVRESIVKTHQEQSMKLDEDSQKQESFLRSSQLSEHSPKNRRQRTAETSIQAGESSQSVQPRKTTTPKTMSFAG
ncbi:BID domain-containing T4SS effector [Bartonella acomydis]|uniref:BepF protein n=1 Tax=Bartonella acomydis TaxID=686234 RepID=A0ABP9MXA1_9HYPH